MVLTRKALSNSTRHYIDKSKKETGFYKYVLRTVFANGNVTKSSSIVFYEKPIPVPSISNLRVKRIVKVNDDKRKVAFIQLTWHPPTKNPERVRTYRVYYEGNDGKLTYNASSPNITDTSCKLPIYWKTKKRTFAVAVIDKNFREGFKVKTEVELRGRTFDPPTNLNFINPSKNLVYSDLTWEYPSANDLKGFRVYRKVILGEFKLMYDEQHLPANVKSIRVGPNEAWKEYVYKVRAVDKDGVLSQNSKHKVYTHRKDTRLKSKAENLKAEIVNKDGTRKVRVSWDFDEDSRDLLDTFVLSSNQNALFASNLPYKTTENSVLLELKEEAKGSIKIEVNPHRFSTGKVVESTFTEVTIPILSAAKPSLSKTVNETVESKGKSLIYIVLGVVLFIALLIIYLKTKNA